MTSTATRVSTTPPTSSPQAMPVSAGSSAPTRRSASTPAELEAVLLGNPEIADAAVIGVRDDESGEELPKAFVVRAPGSSITEQEVMDFVISRVAPHKKIRMVEFIEQVPKSAAGKILRKDLKARA